uniref:Uncharacterized protein n=1 Tax=Oryza punctata TaxID=4537 RepID=A0A0E0JYI4_ORYPU
MVHGTFSPRQGAFKIGFIDPCKVNQITLRDFEKETEDNIGHFLKAFARGNSTSAKAPSEQNSSARVIVHILAHIHESASALGCRSGSLYDVMPSPSSAVDRDLGGSWDGNRYTIG